MGKMRACIIHIVLTRWCNHFLPLLKERCFETISGIERVGLVPRHELLHGFQNDTQLEKKEYMHDYHHMEQIYTCVQGP